MAVTKEISFEYIGGQYKSYIKGNNYYIELLESGTLTFKYSHNNIRVILVGGGGGGAGRRSNVCKTKSDSDGNGGDGGYGGGGGGGGEVLDIKTNVIANTHYKITIGSGGLGGESSSDNICSNPDKVSQAPYGACPGLDGDKTEAFTFIAGGGLGGKIAYSTSDPIFVAGTGGSAYKKGGNGGKYGRASAPQNGEDGTIVNIGGEDRCFAGGGGGGYGGYANANVGSDEYSKGGSGGAGNGGNAHQPSGNQFKEECQGQSANPNSGSGGGGCGGGAQGDQDKVVQNSLGIAGGNGGSGIVILEIFEDDVLPVIYKINNQQTGDYLAKLLYKTNSSVNAVEIQELKYGTIQVFPKT